MRFEIDFQIRHNAEAMCPHPHPLPEGEGMMFAD